MFDAGTRPPYWKIGCGPYFRRINSCIYLPTANRDRPRVEMQFRVRCYRTPKTDDPEIRRLLAEEDGLRLAREKLLREEAESVAAAAAEKENLRRMQRTVRPGAGLEAPPPPGGPGRR